MEETGTLGTGLVMTDDHEINVVLMLNPATADEVAVAIPVDVAKQVIAGLQRMVDEAELVSAAVVSMPSDAAIVYMDNWALRQRDRLN